MVCSGDTNVDSSGICEVVDVEIDCQMFVGKFLWCLQIANNQ